MRLTLGLLGFGFVVLVTAVLVLVFTNGRMSGWTVKGLMVPLGLVLALLVTAGIRTKASQRWTNLLAAAILLLMFSAFAILSFGMLTLPFAVGLLLLSIWKLWLGDRAPDSSVPAKRS